MAYDTDDVRLRILRFLDVHERTSPATQVGIDTLLQQIDAAPQDIRDAVLYLADHHQVQYSHRDGRGAITLLAAGKDALDAVEPEGLGERDQIRLRILRLLDERGRHRRNVSYRAADIAGEVGVDERTAHELLRDLLRWGWVARVSDGPLAVRITARGHTVVEQAQRPAASGERRREGAVHYHLNLQHATIGQVMQGSEIVQSGPVRIHQAPAADAAALRLALDALRRELAADRTLSSYARHDAEVAINAIEGEVVKPANAQEPGKLQHYLHSLLGLVSEADTILGLAEHLQHLLGVAH